MTENDVLTRRGDEVPLSLRATSRLLGKREAQYRDEVDRLIVATITVMRGSPSLDPRVSDIVTQAGLSNAAFYRHFTSKDELLVAVMDYGLRVLVEHLQRRMDEHEGPVDRVRAWIRGMLDQARNPTAAGATRPFVLDRARLAANFPDEVRRSLEVLTAPLAAALAEVEELLAADLSPERGARITYELCQAVLETHLTIETPPGEDDVERTIAFALRGLGLRP